MLSGKFKILSGKCQGILYPPERGNPAQRYCYNEVDLYTQQIKLRVIILQNAEVCGRTPGQQREPKLPRFTGPLNNSKGSL